MNTEAAEGTETYPSWLELTAQHWALIRARLQFLELGNFGHWECFIVGQLRSEIPKDKFWKMSANAAAKIKTWKKRLQTDFFKNFDWKKLWVIIIDINEKKFMLILKRKGNVSCHL